VSYRLHDGVGAPLD